MTGRPELSPRCVALVGPYQSGKSTLLESLLFAAGTLKRKGSTKDGSSVADASPEARARQMGVELQAAYTQYLGDNWTILDCPGSVELAQEAVAALQVVDAAVVVCEPLPDKALALQPLLRMLDNAKIPHYIFINKMDTATSSVHDVMAALQSVSQRPLLLREIPIKEGDQVTGYVDLISERAWKVRPGQPSEMTKMPETLLPEEQHDRNELLEHLADFDDKLMEELLEGVTPTTDEIYKTLTEDVHKDLVVPVLLGSAEQGYGVRRLWKALRHEAPFVDETAARVGIGKNGGGVLVQVCKTWNLQHTGRLSLARIWRGSVSEGMTLGGQRLGSLGHVFGPQVLRLTDAGAGDVVGLGRMENLQTGQMLGPSGPVQEGQPWPTPPPPVFALAIASEKRTDDVKLGPALQRLCEEDPSLTMHVDAESHEMMLFGQGEMHLNVALDRLRGRYGLQVLAHRPPVPYRETIKKGASKRYRHKRQTGGHGQFAEIDIDIQPLPRGSGFQFDEVVVGGAVPRNYIPAVEEGAQEYMARGPLGFPVVDVKVVLKDGQFHPVDSSDMAFKTAARQAMTEAMPQCDPVLLEPIGKIEIAAPTEFTPGIQRLLTGRRGQILGFGEREGWQGWDVVSGFLPQSDVHDFIVELRSITQGIGSFQWTFDHLQELTGKPAEKVIADQKARSGQSGQQVAVARA